MASGGQFSWVWGLVPGAAAGIFGGGLWLGVEHTKGGLVGWVLLMVVVGTVAGVFAGALGGGMAGSGRRLVLALGVLAGVMTILLTYVVGMAAGFGAGVRAAAVGVSWALLWWACGWGLRRWGMGVGVGVGLALAAVCMALPVGAMPVVRAAGHWGGPGSAWQGRAAGVVARGCPFFAALGALRPAVRVDWGALPGMYEWSGLGQEVPMEMPGEWGSAALYAGAGVVVGGVVKWLSG